MPLSKDFHISIQNILYRRALAERERKEYRVQRKDLIQMHFSNQIFLEKIKNGNVDVSGGGI